MSQVLVLGGGFAGLSAAVHLAAAGVEVLLIEQQATLGGKASQVEIDGFRFDTGPSVFTMPEVLAETFAVAGRELPIALRPLDRLCRYHFASGRVWDVFQEEDRTTEQLSEEEAVVYRNLLQEARRLFETSAPTFVFGAAPKPLDLLRYGLRHGWRAYPLRTLAAMLESHGATDDLSQFFLRFATYFGADPYRAPAVLHNIAWVELGMGVSHPAGGIRGVVAALEDLARDLGVRMVIGERVQRLHRSGRRLTTVETDCANYPADMVVSALDVVRSYRLLGRRHPSEGSEPSLSGLVLLLGVEGRQPDAAHHTIVFPHDYREEFAAIQDGRYPAEPTLYLNVTSRSEPGDAPAGHENWFVMANAPALAPGAQGDPERETAYGERLEAILERRGLLDPRKVVVRKVLGPSHLARYGHRGSIYGRAPHSLLATLRPPQRVPGVGNMVLAGGTVFPGGGVPLALLSGRAAARLVLRKLERERQPSL